MNVQWQGTKHDRSGTLLEQLDGWALYVTEMDRPERDDFRVLFTEGAKQILHDFNVELANGVVSYLPDSGHHRFSVVWMGMHIARVLLGWTKVPSGYVYEVITMNGQGEEA